LESQIVFPAACYLAMAIEALSQVQSSQSLERPTFEFRHISIDTALIIPDNNDTRDSVELHTNLSPLRLSTNSFSADWHEFSISSFAAATSTMHCSGSIRAVNRADCAALATAAFTVTDTENFEEWPRMGIWYERFSSQGLRFGKHFQSVERLRTDGNRSRHEATGFTRLTPISTDTDHGAQYTMHPIAIDAAIQVAIMTSAAGDVNRTHVYLPVSIESCSISTNRPLLRDPKAQGVIHSKTIRTSPSTLIASSTLWSQSTPSEARMHIQAVRVVQYKASITKQDPFPRQPCLRVQWKPLIRCLHPQQNRELDLYLTNHGARYYSAQNELPADETISAIRGLIDLAAHENPRLRILELGESSVHESRQVHELLGYGTDVPRYKTWQRGRMNLSGAVEFYDRPDCEMGSLTPPFDLVLAMDSAAALVEVQSFASLLGTQGTLITRDTVLDVGANGDDFTLAHLPGSGLVLRSPRPTGALSENIPREVIIVVRQGASQTVATFAETLSAHLQMQSNIHGVKVVSLCAIQNEELSRDNACICLLELENELLASMNQFDMDCLKIITNTVTSIIWLSGADSLSERLNPDFSLVQGFSRALMLEQPSLNFILLDVGDVTGQNELTSQNVSQLLQSFLEDSTLEKDKEFIQKDGLLYVSRFYPDSALNRLFRRRFQGQDAIGNTPLSEAHPAALASESVDGVETLHFRQVREPFSPLPDDFIEVHIKALSLNAKDIYALKGRIDTRGATTGLEFSGVVVAVGLRVADLQVGDTVVVGMPCQVATSLRTPAWAAQRLLPGEEHTAMATLPTIYGTAIYALMHKAHLCPGESILIHGGAGAFGYAAITIAKNILGSTAAIYTTAASQTNRDFISSHLGIPESNIFHSRNSSFATGIKSATKGLGVDVVVNFLTGDLLQISWDCIAPFGRFVEVGKRDLVDAGRLDMHVFLRNATFTAFDFSDLYYHQLETENPLFSRYNTLEILVHKERLILGFLDC
jgi:NADPH:quinone reductase-like Zn-dependent oxidoreductase